MYVLLQLTDLNEKNVHLWMLSRISYAAKTCNEALMQYDFALATSTCYNLWLYELCDIYLVSITNLIYTVYYKSRKFIYIYICARMCVCVCLC